MGVCSGGQRQRTTLLSMSRLTARSLYLPSFMEGATSKSVWQGCSDAACQCGHTADLCIMAKRDFDLRVTCRCMARTSTTGVGCTKRCVPAPNSVQAVSCTALPLQALARSSASDCPYWDGLDVSRCHIGLFGPADGVARSGLVSIQRIGAREALCGRRFDGGSHLGLCRTEEAAFLYSKIDFMLFRITAEPDISQVFASVHIALEDLEGFKDMAWDGTETQLVRSFTAHKMAYEDRIHGMHLWRLGELLACIWPKRIDDPDGFSKPAGWSSGTGWSCSRHLCRLR